MPGNQAQWIRLLRQDGWRRETGGKHQVKMTKQGMRPVTLPDNHRRAYSKGFEAQLRRETRLGAGDRSRAQEARRRRETERER